MKLFFRTDYKTQRRRSRIRKLVEWVLTNVLIVFTLLATDLIAFTPGRTFTAYVLVGFSLIVSGAAIGLRSTERSSVEYRGWSRIN